MRKISDSTRPNSRGDCASEGTDSGDSSEVFTLIKLANRKVKLIDILHFYGIKIEKGYSEWSGIPCPLPDHKDNNPSFYYNFSSNHFHCKGCHKSGKAVEFISIYEGIEKAIAAQIILSKYGHLPTLDELDYFDDLSPILLDGSKFLQKAVQKHKNNPSKMAIIRRAMQWLDLYISNASGRHDFVKNLDARIERVKEIIDDL